MTNKDKSATPENFNIRDQRDARLRGQLRMNSSNDDLRMINGFRTTLRGIGLSSDCPFVAFRTRFHRMKGAEFGRVGRLMLSACEVGAESLPRQTSHKTSFYSIRKRVRSIRRSR